MKDQVSNAEGFGRVRKERQPYAPNIQVQVLRTSWVIVAFLILQVGAGDGESALRLTQQEQHDSYAIYSMLLKLDQWRVHSPILGIQEETRIFRPAAGVGDSACVWPEPSPEEQEIYRPLIENFKRRNVRPLVLQEEFDLPSYRLLTAREVEEVGEKYPPVPPPPSTREPLEQHPTLSGINVVFFLSAVGFSSDHGRALVYIATWNGGRYYFLVRRHGKWTIDKDYRGTICNWVV